MRDALASSSAPSRRGWCPGALRPMATGDGLLVRVRLTAGILPSGTARALAGLARLHGNGELDLSARAALQIRGVQPATLAVLTDGLSALGLLDATPEAEAARNVIASPLAGLDPSETLDAHPLASALERALASSPDAQALPGKFGWLVDGGGALRLDDVRADVRFEALPHPVRPRLVVRFDTGRGPLGVGLCAPGQAPMLAMLVARGFNALRGLGSDAPRRMRDLGVAGRARLAASLCLDPLPTPFARAETITAEAPARAPIGPLLLSCGAVSLGVGLPFGRTSADGLERLAAFAEQQGSGELRLTPWRAVHLPGVRGPLGTLLASLQAEGFILDPSDSRRFVHACPGRAGCRSGTTDTHADAVALAMAAGPRLGPDRDIHVSGCAKGCAHPGASALTLVGDAGGYGLVSGGTARDAPVARVQSTGIEASLAWLGATPVPERARA